MRIGCANASPPPRRDDIESENLKEFAKLYPFARRTEPLLYSDDEQQNQVQTTEFYAIAKMWSRLPDEAYYHARIYSMNVDDALAKPAVLFRSMPLGLPYPVHQVFHAEINISSGLPIDAANVRIDNPAFYFQRTISASGGKLFLNYEYRSWI